MEEEIVLFLNKLDFIMGIERMRRETDAFEMEIVNVFDLSDETVVLISRANRKEEEVPLSEIMGEFNGVDDDGEESKTEE